MRSGRRVSWSPYDDAQPASPLELARQQLRIWKPARITPRLMGLLQDNIMPAPAIVDLLIRTGDARCIPTVAAMLEADPPAIYMVTSRQRGPDGRTITQARADVLLLVLLRLTNQSPSTYGMEPLPHDTQSSHENYGFEKAADRKQAVDQTKQWFADNKDRYKDVEAMTLPTRPKWVLPPPRWPGHPTATPSDGPYDDVLDVAPLCEEIARAVTRLTAGLDGPTPASRAQAQQRLIDLHSRLTGPLLASAHRPTPKFLLQNLAALCEGLAYAATLDRPMRDKLLLFRDRNDDLFRKFFQLELQAQQETLAGLSRKDDATGSAEAIVILGLSSYAPAVREAACEAAASGRYRSDRVIDLLCEQLAGRSTEIVAVRALTKVATPRIAPLLLSRMRDDYYGRCELYRDALVATGDPRLVPALVARLGTNKDVSNTGTVNGKSITVCLDDHYLYILLKLTGQSPADYDLHVPPESDRSSYYRMLGFANLKSRETAYAKMRTWWDAKKDQPPYKDLEPLPAPPPVADTGPNFSEFDFDDYD
jgi:hypothetical protein